MCRRGDDLRGARVALGALLCLAVAPYATGARAAWHGDKTVHLIFSNHLDIGFTDMDDKVISLYFNHHYPVAVALAKEMNSRPGGDRFVYLTHSFIVSLYLDCPPGMGFECPEPEAVEEFEAAVRRGDVTWHAMPFNPHYELFETELLKFALNMTFDLDLRFGVRRKATASLRDVPGMTRGVVPLFADAGVRAISGGVNAFSAPPGVPHVTPFIWRDEASGKEIFAMWHPGGYGGYGPGDCIEAPGFDHILCVYWKEDNAGPPATVEEIEGVYRTVRSEYPGAHVIASTFDAYIDSLEAAAPGLDLEVVTGEIGDTWVHGVGSEVIKVADYMAATRLRTACLNDPACDSQSYAFHNFSRLLLKIPEHTWGIAFLQYFGDVSNYTTAYLQQHLSRVEDFPSYGTVIRSWNHMYSWVPAALGALPPEHPIRTGFDADLAFRECAEATSGRRLLTAGARTVMRGRPAAFETRHWHIKVDWESGAISRLQRKYPAEPAPASQGASTLLRRRARTLLSDPQPTGVEAGAPGHRLGVDWAEGLSRLAQIEYHVYNASDYQPVWDHYAHLYPVWDGDFGKANLSATWTRSAAASPRLINIYDASGTSTACGATAGGANTAADSLALHLEYVFPRWMVKEAGAPARMWTIVEASPADATLRLTVVWQRKTPTRAPEALWVRFQPGPRSGDPDTWLLNKLGSLINPQEVILNGSHSIHAVQQRHSASVADPTASERLSISTLDTALVAMGAASAFPNPCSGPDMTLGVSFNLVNNIWGTNWPQWIPYWERDVNRTYRFVLRVEEVMPPSGDATTQPMMASAAAGQEAAAAAAAHGAARS